MVPRPDCLLCHVLSHAYADQLAASAGLTPEEGVEAQPGAQGKEGQRQRPRGRDA